MPDVSIIIPSIYPRDLARCVASIERGTRCSYEVVIVAPDCAPECPDSSVIWIREQEPRGAAAAQHVGLDHCSGDFVIALADDFEFFDGWDAWLIPEFEARESAHPTPLVMGLRYDLADWVGTCFGMYYPNFPMMRRACARSIGWFDGDYRQGFSDCDLGMRVWSLGGFCAFSSRPAIFLSRDESGRTVDDVRKGKLYEQADYDRFVARWSPRYGAGWCVAALGSFNVNVSISARPHLVTDGCTILQNHAPSALTA